MKDPWLHMKISELFIGGAAIFAVGFVLNFIYKLIFVRRNIDGGFDGRFGGCRLAGLMMLMGMAVLVFAVVSFFKVVF